MSASLKKRRGAAKVLSAKLCSKPSWVPPPKYRPRFKRGIVYENNFAAHLNELGIKNIHGQWFSYKIEGVATPLYCQTDFLLPIDEIIIVIDTKYSFAKKLEDKFEALYLPCVRLCFPGKKVHALQVFTMYNSQHLHLVKSLLIFNISEALRKQYSVLKWP